MGLNRSHFTGVSAQGEMVNWPSPAGTDMRGHPGTGGVWLCGQTPAPHHPHSAGKGCLGRLVVRRGFGHSVAELLAS